jgi:hypothetical protein
VRRETVPRAAPGNVRDAERGEHALLGFGVRERLECSDECRCSRRAHELRAETLRLGDDELDRDALDGNSERSPFRAVDDGHDLRQG